MTLDWRIEVLRNNVQIGIVRASSCNLIFDSSADVKRSGKVEMIRTEITGGNTFQPFTDRIRPVMIDSTGEHYLGKYMCISMPEELSDTGSIYQIEMYDETMILKQAGFEGRVNYAQGARYQTIIEGLLVDSGITNYYIDETTATLQTEREFAPGDNYLTVINTLLDEINYEHVYAGLDGFIYLKAKQQKVTADHVYSDKKHYRLLKPINRDTDIYSLPNVLIGVVSNPDTDTPLIHKVVNDDLNSQISVPNRGYKVVRVYRLSNIASQSDLEAYIQAEYLKSTQMTETAQIATAPEHSHEYGDTVQLDTDLISGLYTEVAWNMDLGVNNSMTHRLERKVFI